MKIIFLSMVTLLTTISTLSAETLFCRKSILDFWGNIQWENQAFNLSYDASQQKAYVNDTVGENSTKTWAQLGYKNIALMDVLIYQNGQFQYAETAVAATKEYNVQRNGLFSSKGVVFDIWFWDRNKNGFFLQLATIGLENTDDYMSGNYGENIYYTNALFQKSSDSEGVQTRYLCIQQ